jgi:amino acid adenylation domain-containing protein
VSVDLDAQREHAGVPDVLAALLEWSARRPAGLALSDGTREISYAELVVELERRASGLCACGVQAGDRVALALGNTLDFPLTALACLWVGASFVPLACDDPEERRTAFVRLVDASLLVVETGSGGRTADRGRGGELSVEAGQLATTARKRPACLDDSLLAYCIFTSGSTGEPKAVAIGRTALARALARSAAAYGMDHSTRALCISPFHFDGGLGALLVPLVAGGTAIVADRRVASHPRSYVSTLLEQEVNHASFVPSFLRLLLASPSATRLGDSLLRSVAVGGEALPKADAVALRELLPGVRLYNRYGPTEATIAVTTFEVTTDVLREHEQIPIGLPHTGVSFHVLTGDGRLVDEPWVPGGLLIGGDQLMDGYFRDEELTRRVLLDSVVPGRRLYVTGDLVERDEHGHYLYLGRLDDVVKRAGARISLGEVAAGIRSLPAIRAVACVSSETLTPLRIAAFVVAADPRPPAQLRKELSGVLPAAMLPDAIVLLEDLPLTSQGKTDAAALRQIAADYGWSDPPGALEAPFETGS